MNKKMSLKIYIFIIIRNLTCFLYIKILLYIKLNFKFAKNETNSTKKLEIRRKVSNIKIF